MLKENEKSLRYEITREEYDIENLQIRSKRVRKAKVRISKNKIDERQKFSTREEALRNLIDVAEERMKQAKKILETYPKVIELLETISELRGVEEVS